MEINWVILGWLIDMTLNGFVWLIIAAVFAATNEPVWIAVGVAIGAAMGWRKPKKKNEKETP